MKINGFYTRAITAIIIGIVTLALVLWNDISQHIFIWLVALLCAQEYIRIRSAGSIKPVFTWLFAFLAGPALSITNYINWMNFSPVFPLLVISVFYMLYLLGRLFFNYLYGPGKATIISSAFLYIGLPFVLLSHFLKQNDFEFLLINLILLIWVSDTFAYIMGSLIGKRKLMPGVSPGKTIEGALGALLFTLIASYILYLYLPVSTSWGHLGMGVLIWFFGLCGDLVESHLKRSHQIKDSGHLLPGHGGFLDRFDAFIYLLPFVLLYLSS